MKTAAIKQAQIENYVEESPVCGFAKEIFLKMVELGKRKNWVFWTSDQDKTEQLLQEAIDSCHLRPDFILDEELYRGDIAQLIDV